MTAQDEPEVVRVEFTIEPSWTIDHYSDVIEIPAADLAGLSEAERHEKIQGWVEDEVNNVCSWGFSELSPEGED